MSDLFTGMQLWLVQIRSILMHRFNHLTPHEYCMMLLLCITLGVFLLRGKS